MWVSAAPKWAACAGQPVYRYLAGHELKTIPLPTFNVVNGGNNRGIRQAFNEFILAPYKAGTVEEAVAMAVQVYRRLEKVIPHYCKNAEPFLGDSYGWAAPSKDPELVLDLMQEAVEQCGYTDRMAYCLDCASSEMYDKESGTYELNGSRVTSEELIQYMKMLTEKVPLLFVEDLLDENDWAGFEKAHKILTRTNLIGDDFIVTNRERLEEACKRNAIDGFILKPNQVGTLTIFLGLHIVKVIHPVAAAPAVTIDTAVAAPAVQVHIVVTAEPGGILILRHNCLCRNQFHSSVPLWLLLQGLPVLQGPFPGQTPSTFLAPAMRRNSLMAAVMYFPFLLANTTLRHASGSPIL